MTQGPNNGQEVGGFRVLLTQTSDNVWAWPERALVESIAAGGAWDLVISAAESPREIARRRFRSKRDAERARAELVALIRPAGSESLTDQALAAAVERLAATS